MPLWCPLISLVDPGGVAASVHPPTGSNSFVFAYVFAKKHPHQRSAPPNGSVPPPMGNPGSATEYGNMHILMIFLIYVLTDVVIASLLLK